MSSSIVYERVSDFLVKWGFLKSVESEWIWIQNDTGHLIELGDTKGPFIVRLESFGRKEYFWNEKTFYDRIKKRPDFFRIR